MAPGFPGCRLRGSHSKRQGMWQPPEKQLGEPSQPISPALPSSLRGSPWSPAVSTSFWGRAGQIFRGHWHGKQLSFGKIMSRFLPGWDTEQVSFDSGIGGRKFGTGPGLEGKQLAFEDKSRKLFLATASSSLAPQWNPGTFVHGGGSQWTQSRRPKPGDLS